MDPVNMTENERQSATRVLDVYALGGEALMWGPTEEWAVNKGGALSTKVL